MASGSPQDPPQGPHGGGLQGTAGVRFRPLGFLRQNPQFQQLRQMVQANPQILQPMLQELGKQNPQMLQLINANQQEFLQLISEEVPGMEGMAGMEGMPPPPTIQMTEEEKAAVDRLEAMGFNRIECIQAFFACDKNEALAANFLLENAGDAMQ